MKKIIIITAFIGIFFLHLGMAQAPETLGRILIESFHSHSLEVKKVFDSNNKMLCYTAFYNDQTQAIDCLKGEGNQTVLIHLDSFSANQFKIIKVLDSEENIICYIAPSSLYLPKTGHFTATVTIDCEKI